MKEELRNKIDSELKFFEVRSFYDSEKLERYVDDEFGQTGKNDKSGKWENININGLIFSLPKTKKK